MVRHGARWAVVLVAALFVASAGCSAGPKQADGHVYDSHTGDPIEGAEVTLGSARTTTAEDGSFSLSGKGGQVRVQAEYYSSGAAGPGAGLRIDLAPFEVSAEVTSELSGRPVVAHLSFRAPRGEARTSADGTATLFATGLGATVTVRALGYDAVDVTVPDDLRMRVALKPAALDPEDLFAAARGVRFADLPADSVDRDRREYFALNPASEQRVRWYSLKSAVKDGTAVAFVRVVSFDPATLAVPGYFSRFEIPGCTGALAARGGVDVFGCRLADTSIEAFQMLAARISVNGPNEAAVRQVSDALIAAYST